MTDMRTRANADVAVDAGLLCDTAAVLWSAILTEFTYSLLKFPVKYRCGESYCIASYGPSNNCMALYTSLPPVCHRRAEN